MRKKPPQPVTALQSLLREATEQSVVNYDAEKAADIKKAYQGWKALHTNILYQLDHLTKVYGLTHLTGEEEYTIQRIKDLNLRARDNMNRLETLLMKELSDMNSAYKSKSIDSALGGPQRRMLRTLRSPKSSLHRSSPHVSASLVSQTAAARIWSEEYQKVDTALLFKDFSSVNDQMPENLKPRPEKPPPLKHRPKPKVKPSTSKFNKAELPKLNALETKSEPKLELKTKSDLKTVKPIKQKPRKNNNAIYAPQPKPVLSETALRASKQATATRPAKSASAFKTASPRLDKPKPKASTDSEVSDEKSAEGVLEGSGSASSTELVTAEEVSELAKQEKIIAELKGVDADAARQIFNEIVDKGDPVRWDDVAGLEQAKHTLKEAVIYPFLRPDLFSGLREPVRGLLLFGPPGTGKTMLAKAVATESKLTFFLISASSLTSKYLGESEKLVRALFTLAKRLSPSIIFIDEIDSLLSARSDNDNESSRRIKTEFLVQWNGLSHAAVSSEEQPRVLVLAATNLPWEIDEAARRRFAKRQYIPLPEPATRRAQLTKMLSHIPQECTLNEAELDELVAMTDGFSGSDITALTKDAAMNPLRELGDQLLFTPKEQIRGLRLDDFKVSLQYIRPSVSKIGLERFDEWARLYGSSGA